MIRVLLIFITGIFLSFSHAARTDPLHELQAIHKKVLDPNEMFSISKTMGKIEDIEPRVKDTDYQAQGEIAFLRGLILWKANSPKESLEFTQKALEIHQKHPFLSEQEQTDTYHNLAQISEELGEWDIAIPAYQKVMAVFESDKNLPLDQQLFPRERLAYCLHESGRYEEAKSMNKISLLRAEKAWGKEDKRLIVTMMNLAQNEYMLENYEASKLLLEKLFKVTTKHNEITDLDITLFQLGVLEFELGNDEKAEYWMKKKLELAQQSGDEDRIEESNENLQMLYDKIQEKENSAPEDSGDN
ncbi:tetratricopeptide repeat protein [Xenorhabdus szentirmaii]|uniref:tetratricopeptide repeat protein n=1 Tax=Xenorhabdus szentirmaii TaxID=290112 RepID=UPI00198A9D49|nr:MULTISPECIES: tetratricopeptide repeat protein [unclassified Xenorhabdus]MBD2781722.1 tetratricopeptide repeat protein [Xenorhabdus sp. 38]MBD2826088.1 tetratricopeptide repeat protein [Xenorhabdus sp. 5]